MRQAIRSVVILAILSSAGCSIFKKQDPNQTLYAQLGGQPAITQVVDDFVGFVAADDKVNFTRQGIPGAQWDPTTENVSRLKTELVNYFTTATNGPKLYKGKNMHDVHRNMQITEAEFDAAEIDLKKALDKNRVPANLQKELLDIVQTTKKDIVTKS